MMSAPDERLTEDPLFLACTRPAMIAGAPMEAVALTVIVSATVFLAAHSLVYLLIAPVLHGICRAICKHDPNAFRVLWLYVDTKGRSRNAATWGGSSFSPMAVCRRFAPAELSRG
jgi:type IV secretion system protein VirB3